MDPHQVFHSFAIPTFETFTWTKKQFSCKFFLLNPMSSYSRAETAESDDEDAKTDSEAHSDDDQHWGPVWEDLLPVRGSSRGHHQGVYNRNIYCVHSDKATFRCVLRTTISPIHVVVCLEPGVILSVTPPWLFDSLHGIIQQVCPFQYPNGFKNSGQTTLFDFSPIFFQWIQ